MNLNSKGCVNLKLPSNTRFHVRLDNEIFMSHLYSTDFNKPKGLPVSGLRFRNEVNNSLAIDLEAGVFFGGLGEGNEVSAGLSSRRKVVVG